MRSGASCACHGYCNSIQLGPTEYRSPFQLRSEFLLPTVEVLLARQGNTPCVRLSRSSNHSAPGCFRACDDSSILSCISQSINTAILNCSACTFSFDLCFWLAYKIGSPVFAVEFCEQFLRLRFRSVTRQTITHPPGTRLARFRIFARCVEVTRNIAKQCSGMESHSAFYDNGTRNRVCAKDSQVGQRTFECSGSRDVSSSYTAV